MPTFLILTLHHPGSDKPQSVSNLFLLEYLSQHVSSLEAMDALTVVIADAVQLVLLLLDLPLQTVDDVHGPVESCHLSDE